MPTRTISITDEAYEALKSLKDSDRMSFSEVILKYYPLRRSLSAILRDIAPTKDLPETLERVSRDLRKGSLRQADL